MFYKRNYKNFETYTFLSARGKLTLGRFLVQKFMISKKRRRSHGAVNPFCLERKFILLLKIDFFTSFVLYRHGVCGLALSL